jgi:hypothetical protein
MDLLRRNCSALVDRYLYAQLATFLGLACPRWRPVSSMDISHWRWVDCCWRRWC